MTEEIYKEIKEKKSGPMRSYRCTRVSVILGSGIGRFDCIVNFAFDELGFNEIPLHV